MNAHELPLPQVQVPFAHAARQLALSPSQVAWQGGAGQTKVQSSPAGQAQVPPWQPSTNRPQAGADRATANSRAAQLPKREVRKGGRELLRGMRETYERGGHRIQRNG